MNAASLGRTPVPQPDCLRGVWFPSWPARRHSSSSGSKRDASVPVAPSSEHPFRRGRSDRYGGMCATQCPLPTRPASQPAGAAFSASSPGGTAFPLTDWQKPNRCLAGSMKQRASATAPRLAFRAWVSVTYKLQSRSTWTHTAASV